MQFLNIEIIIFLSYGKGCKKHQKIAVWILIQSFYSYKLTQIHTNENELRSK